jgi:hypothetical protein
MTEEQLLAYLEWLKTLTTEDLARIRARWK